VIPSPNRFALMKARAVGSSTRVVSNVRIMLIRHGQTSDVPPRWPTGSQLERWLEGYRASGLAEAEAPPALLKQCVQDAHIVSSDLRRAIESAALLASGANVPTTPLLREMSLSLPQFRGLRLPLKLWALVVGVPFARATKRMRESGPYAPDLARAREAARWLSAVAAANDSVAAVTHGAFRHLLAFTLECDGWRASPLRRRSQPWSVWELTKDRVNSARG
jgi:broad specificity phosphatase PhoE